MIIKNIKEFLNLVSTNECPMSLELDLTNPKVNPQAAKNVSFMIPMNMRTYVDYLSLDSNAIKSLAEVITKCPKGLTINLAYNFIENGGVSILSEALEGGCPQGLSINLTYNAITDRGIEMLVNALIKGNCHGLTLNLDKNCITWQGMQLLTGAAEKVSGLKIKVDDEVIKSPFPHHLELSIWFLQGLQLVQNMKLPANIFLNIAANLINYSYIETEKLYQKCAATVPAHLRSLTMAKLKKTCPNVSPSLTLFSAPQNEEEVAYQKGWLEAENKYQNRTQLQFGYQRK